MATLLVQHHEKDFAVWKKSYDSVFDLRASRGEQPNRVYRGAGHPKKLTVVQKWSALANARKWSPSPALKIAMEKTGVDSLAVVNFPNEA